MQVPVLFRFGHRRDRPIDLPIALAWFASAVAWAAERPNSASNILGDPGNVIKGHSAKIQREVPAL